MQNQVKIVPSSVRFIRLGPRNRWAAACMGNGRIILGHREVPHDLAITGNWVAARAALEEDVGRSKATVTSALREVKEFYSLGSDCLWVTFWNGRLWWTFAEPDVCPMRGDRDRDGARYRRVIGQWRSTDIFGCSLLIDRLSEQLTKTRLHRRTVCRVAHEDAAIRAINGVVA